MKRIIILSKANDYPSEDLRRLRKIFFVRDYDVDFNECVLLWEKFSSHYNSKWVNLSNYTDEQIFNNLYDFWIEVKE